MISLFVLCWIYFTESAMLGLGLTLLILGFRDLQTSLVVTGAVLSVASLMFLYGSMCAHIQMIQDDTITASRPSTTIPTIIIESDNPVNIVFRERDQGQQSKRINQQEQDPSAFV